MNIQIVNATTEKLKVHDLEEGRCNDYSAVITNDRINAAIGTKTSSITPTIAVTPISNFLGAEKAPTMETTALLTVLNLVLVPESAMMQAIEHALDFFFSHNL